MLRIEIKNLTEARIPAARHLKKAIRTVLKKLQRKADGELNLVFVTDRKIKRLNRKYRNKDSATDVLAFGMEEQKPLHHSARFFGDIVISVDAASRHAKEFGSSRNKELVLYVIHGILHLVGFDDETKRGFERMNKTEEELLKEIWNSKA